MSIEFIATECGFHGGLGGASNAAADEDYHYILFGRQTDSQHPQNSGTYVEFDDQCNGDVNVIEGILISDSDVTFKVAKSGTIRVRRHVSEVDWQEFLRGIAESFETELIQYSPEV